MVDYKKFQRHNQLHQIREAGLKWSWKFKFSKPTLDHYSDNDNSHEKSYPINFDVIIHAPCVLSQNWTLGQEIECLFWAL